MYLIKLFKQFSFKMLSNRIILCGFYVVETKIILVLIKLLVLLRYIIITTYILYRILVCI